MTPRKIIAMLLVCCMAIALGACGKDENRNDDLVVTPPAATSNVQDDPANTEEPDTPAEMPTETSADVELYAVNPGSAAASVVNAFGQKANGYSLDKDGNSVDRDGALVVAAASVAAFRDINSLRFSADSYPAVLTAKEEAADGNGDDTTVKQYPSTVTLIINAGPTDATNGIVVLSSSNTAIAEIRAANNSKIIAEGAFEIRSGEIAIDLAGIWTAKIVVTVRSEGDATITARSLSGGVSTTCKVSVKNGEVEATEKPEETSAPVSETINASDDPSLHVHRYTEEVIPPQIGEKGYTLYTCECGRSYKDNFTSPIQEPEDVEIHVHEYTSISVVPPTETESGYTLHTCLCGESYKDSFVGPTGG